MKRSIALALLIGMGVLTWSVALPSAMADCGTCDAPKDKECPACEKNKNKEKCPACEAKKKKDDHGHDH